MGAECDVCGRDIYDECGYCERVAERDAARGRADDLAFQLAGLEHVRRKDNEMFLSMIYAVVDGEGQDHYDAIAAMRKYVRSLRATASTRTEGP